MSDIIKEVQASNRFILKRLNQIVDGKSSCTCPCHTRDAHTELECLRQRINEFEEIEKERDKEMTLLSDQLQVLKQVFDSIQTPGTKQLPTEDVFPFKNAVSVRTPQHTDIYTYHASIEHTVPEISDTADQDRNEAEKNEYSKSQLPKAGTGIQSGVRYSNEVATCEEKSVSDGKTDVTDHGERQVVYDYHIEEQKTHTTHHIGEEQSEEITNSEIKKKNVRFGTPHDKVEVNRDNSVNEGADLNSSNDKHIKNEGAGNLKTAIVDEGNAVVDKGDFNTLSNAANDNNQSFAKDEFKAEGDTSQKQECVNIPENAVGDTHAIPVNVSDRGKDASSHSNKKKPIKKANFHKKSLSESLGVKVIEQTEKRVINYMEWHSAASREVFEGQMSGLKDLKGVFTIVCVDISHSMTQGNAWEQAKTFFKDFIEGLKESRSIFNITEENVALATFGHKTEVLKRSTNDYSSLQMSFDGISLGGPSPMHGGLLMAVAAAQSSNCSGGAVVNGIPVVTKMVLITDGHPTDTNLVAGPDTLTPSEQDDTHSHIMETMQKMEGPFDVFIVPVGNANMEFLQLMRTISDGKMLTFRDGKRVGTRLRKTLMAGGNTFSHLSGHFGVDTGSDEEDIKDILQSAEKRAEHSKSNYYMDTNSNTLPTAGSRVRRGPDWDWGNQDGQGPGTVIGHSTNDQQIWVEWDNNESVNIYRYHPRDGYDVLITDEPRLPKPNGRLTVGCIVKPGKDWKQTTRNVKVTERGVVLKILDDGRVKVRWNNKERGDYSSGLNGDFEVEFSPTEGPAAWGGKGYTLEPKESQYHEYQLQRRQTGRNKNMTNKNIANTNSANKNVTNKDKK